MIFKRKYAAALAAALMVTTAGITAQAFHADTGIVVPVYGLDDSGVHLYDAHIVANDIQTVMNGEDMNLGTLNVNKLTIQGKKSQAVTILQILKKISLKAIRPC